MKFKTSLMASSIAMAAAATSASAQDGQPVMEEVVATGIRGSLMRALDIKRDARGVVDAISAEDIGKFPDTNLAESLQRITGVSIDRSRGEGSRVTVRGFGPDFNLVTLNGRQMPTTGDGRSFDFAKIASEGVAGVEIYKTGKAHVPTGGIGATINVKTNRPLASPGLKAGFGIKAVHDTSTESGDDITPELSGIISQTFAEDTFGVSLTASYQERDNRNQKAAAAGDGWLPFLGSDTSSERALGTGPLNINRPDGDDVYSVPNNTEYVQEEFHRERVNGQLVLQYMPVESVTATLDYTYAEQTVDRTYRNYSGWFAGPNLGSEYTDGPVAAPIFFSDNSEPDIAMATGEDGVKTEDESVGFNVEWVPNDNLTLVFDYHDSTAESSPNSVFGTSMVLQIAPYIRDVTTTYFDQKLPILELSTTEPLTPEAMQIAGSVFTSEFDWMDMKQGQFSGTWEFDEGGSIDFGFSSTEVTNRSAQARVQRNAWSGQNGGRGLFTDLMIPVSSAGDFDQVDGSGDPRRWTDYYTWDTAAVIARAEELQALDPSDPNYLRPEPTGQEADCPSGFCTTSVLEEDRTTTEESDAYYAQVNLEAQLGDMDANISFGMRYEETEVVSKALAPVYDGVDWVAANEFIPVVATDDDGNPIQDFSTLSADYDFILPSIDLSLNISDDWVLRASYSETISRPGYVAIQGGVTIGSILRADEQAATAGNPALNPYLSENYDLSLEWYYGEASYASVGYFRKNLIDFIDGGELEDVLLVPGLPHPLFGPLADAARDAGNADAADIRQYIFDNFAGNPEVDPVGGVISGVSGRDDDVLFEVATSVNLEEELLVQGVEIAVQHTFGETGFGVIANATLVDGDFDYDLTQPAEQVALTGLSDSANLILFYDKDGIQGRVAYNWRDEFLASRGAEPGFTEEYGQWDANFSYDINDNFTVFIEALNITDEFTRGHTRTVNNITELVQTGPRYNFGIRGSF